MALIGDNGSGKSTLFDVLIFLKDALQQNIRYALDQWGRFKEVLSRGQSGPICITINFENDNIFTSYILRIASDHGIAFVEHEGVVHGTQTNKVNRALLAISNGTGSAEVYDRSRQSVAEPDIREVDLKDPTALAIKGLAMFSEFKVAGEINTLLEIWHVSDFSVHDARMSADNRCSEHLSIRGDNVAQAAKFLSEAHPERFRDILKEMRLRILGRLNSRNVCIGVPGRRAGRPAEGWLARPIS